MTKTTRSILINAADRTVSEIYLGHDITDIRGALQSDSVIAVYPEDENMQSEHLIYVDDAVLYLPLEEIEGAYTLDMVGERIIFGNSVIVRYDPLGCGRTDIALSYQHVVNNIRFLTREEMVTEYNRKKDEAMQYFTL